MKLLPLGERGFIVQVADAASAEAASIVRTWAHALEGGRLDGVTDIVPSFATVTVHFDPAQIARQVEGDPRAAVATWIDGLAVSLTTRAPASAGKTVVIPVCYENAHAPDLADVARQAGLTPEQVVALHSAAEYQVRAVGFSPGFPYLGGLPAALQTPRRSSPRTLVPAGSVGIGGAQTGIYSIDTPGGWNLIGRTPERLFLPEANPPTLLEVGDRVRFKPISAREFDAARA